MVDDAFRLSVKMGTAVLQSPKKTTNSKNFKYDKCSSIKSVVSFSRRLSVVLFVEHIVEPKSPFLDVGLVLLVLQLVGDDDSKLVVWSFGT